MSVSRTNSTQRNSQHFEPQDVTDPAAQRRLRGQLEQIDYTAFASNREVIGHTLGHADASKFQRLAVAAAHARALWLAEALSLSETPRALTQQETARLTQLRATFDELAEAYEALRRTVERGYLPFRPPSGR